MIIIRWLKAASVLIALGVAGSGVGLLAQDPKGEPGGAPKPEQKIEAGRNDDASVVPVRPGKFRVTLSERGSVEPTSRSRDVLSRVGLTTIISIKPEWTRVRKGELVAELDSAALRDSLTNQKITILQAEVSFKQARSAREVAEYALKEYAEGVLPRDREILKGKLAQAQAGLRRGEARRERTRLARKRLDEAMAPNKGPVTPSDIVADLTIDDRIDEAELNVSRLELDLGLAKSELEVLEKYTKEKMIGQLTIDVERRTAEGLSRQSAWELEKIKAANLEKQIEGCKLLAPDDGLLAYANDPGRGTGTDRFQIEEGVTIRERQLIFRVIADDDPMRINTKVREGMVDRIEPGQKVRIKVNAFPNEDLYGTVSTVAPRPDPSNRTSSDNRVYTTFVKIDKRPPGLRPGLTVQAEILITEIDNVLSVPVTSVVRLDDKDRVAVKSPGGEIAWREVELGVSNNTSIEVKKGLLPGDLVILDPLSQMSEKMKREMSRKPPQQPARPGSPR